MFHSFYQAASSTLDKYEGLHTRVTEKVVAFLDEQENAGVSIEERTKRCEALKKYWQQRINKYKRELRVSNLFTYSRVRLKIMMILI